MIRSKPSLVVALALVGGCGRHELDLLIDTERPDPCVSAATQEECSERAALGCSFQPNPVGCASTDPACAPGACRLGDPFVRAVEGKLLLNGEPFRPVGVGSWGILQVGQCASALPEERELAIERAFDGLIASRTSLVRAYAFQSMAGPSGTDFALLDAAVRASRRAGTRLMLMLEHGHGDCSDELVRDDEWYRTGYLVPGGGYALSYRDYARAVAERYRDEPTVLGYGLLQSLAADDPAALRAFVDDVGQLVHGVAPSQLVSLDLGYYSSGASLDGPFVELQSLPVVDLVDVDDYQIEEWTPLDPALLTAVAAVGKPAIIGEGAFGIFGFEPEHFQARATRVEQRMLEWRDAGFDGALLWNYLPGWQDLSEEFDARPEDPLLQADGVLANAPW